MSLETAIKPYLAEIDIKDHCAGVPLPVLLNTWKHHAGAIRPHIMMAARKGEAGLKHLIDQTQVIGTELMDLYIGGLSPEEIARRALLALQASNHLAPENFRAWLAVNGGYQVLTFSDDESRWVLRQAEENGRYVHVHPARWAPATLRVRANVLKTAIMVLGHVAVHSGDPLDVALINQVRKQYLDLSPIACLRGDRGIRGVIETLRPQA